MLFLKKRYILPKTSTRWKKVGMELSNPAARSTRKSRNGMVVPIWRRSVKCPCIYMNNLRIMSVIRHFAGSEVPVIRTEIQRTLNLINSKFIQQYIFVIKSRLGIGCFVICKTSFGNDFGVVNIDICLKMLFFEAKGVKVKKIFIICQ